MATADPLELASRVIDSGVAEESTNRITNTLAELAGDIALVESFSHMVAFRTDDGLVCFDASHAGTGAEVTAALRGWSEDPVHSLVYTHGHVDHVGGSIALAADAAARGHSGPRVIGHEAIPARFRRYEETSGYNVAINERQFGNVGRAGAVLQGDARRFLAEGTLWPTTTFADRLTLDVGGVDFVLHHDRGETDDHCWAWVPSHRALCTGDFVLWVFPNAGNPQKVQRYPLEWARALRTMQAYDAELLLPAHGLPIAGTARIDRVLGDLAEALETLVRETLEAMNAGASLDEIVHGVHLPAEDLERPWMRPVYDEPEFVVRNIWRLYGGWWDLRPDTLKPSPRAHLGAELASLAGGVGVLVARARELAEAGDLRLACHLIETAVDADWSDAGAHAARAEIYTLRRSEELSLMAKGIFSGAARESRAITD